MIAKVILFNSCDKIIKNLKFGGFKAQQDYYTIALIGKYYSDLFHPQEIWNSQMISAEMAKTIEELAFFVWNHFQNPTVPGVNVGQWCKKKNVGSFCKRVMKMNICRGKVHVQGC